MNLVLRHLRIIKETDRFLLYHQALLLYPITMIVMLPDLFTHGICTVAWYNKFLPVAIVPETGQEFSIIINHISKPDTPATGATTQADR